MRKLYAIVFLLLWGGLSANAQNLTKATIAGVDTIVRKYGLTHKAVLNEYVENIWNRDKKNAELAVGIAKAYYHYFKAQPNSPYWSYLTSDSANAYKYIDRAINADPKYTPAYIRGGDMQKVMGDTVKALDWYNRGIKAAPTSPDCYIACAKCLLEQRDTVKSLNKMREINGAVPDYPANLAMARICEEVFKYWNSIGRPLIDNWSDYQKHLYAMTDIQHLDSTDYFNYAFLLFSRGEYDKMYDLTQKGLEKYPNNVNVIKMAQYASTQSKKLDEAVSLADKLFSINDTIKFTTYDYENAAVAYQGKNNIKKAVDMYHRAYNQWEEDMRNNVPLTKLNGGNKYMRNIIDIYSNAGLYEDAIAENLTWIEQGRKADKLTATHFSSLAILYRNFAMESFGEERTNLLLKADEAFAQIAEISEENKMYSYYYRWILAGELDSVMNTTKQYDLAIEMQKTFEGLNEEAQMDASDMAKYIDACKSLRSYYIRTGERNGRYCQSAIAKAIQCCNKVLYFYPNEENWLKQLQIYKSLKPSQIIKGC